MVNTAGRKMSVMAPGRAEVVASARPAGLCSPEGLESPRCVWGAPLSRTGRPGAAPAGEESPRFASGAGRARGGPDESPTGRRSAGASIYPRAREALGVLQVRNLRTCDLPTRARGAPSVRKNSSTPTDAIYPRAREALHKTSDNVSPVSDLPTRARARGYAAGPITERPWTALPSGTMSTLCTCRIAWTSCLPSAPLRVLTVTSCDSPTEARAVGLAMMARASG